MILTTDYSNRRIASMLGIAANTVRKYRTRLPESDIDSKSLGNLSDDDLKKLLVVTRHIDTGKRLPDWVYIHNLMQAKHQTLIQLWEEYRAIQPDDAYSYSQFTHHYREFVKTIDVTMRQYYKPGEVCFVDFAGKRIPWTDPITGKEQFAEIFVGVPGYSQYIFAIALKSQKLEDWLYAHQKMFEFFGGTTQLVVPDNLKSAVIKAGKYPVINSSYQELADHYNFVIEPARVARPQDKSLAEVGVLLVTRWIIVVLKRRKFFSLKEINDAIVALLIQLNLRAFKRFEGNRKQRFDDEEKTMLNALPTKAFEIGRWLHEQKVNRDYHVYVHGHAYSVPYELTNQYVDIKVGQCKIEIFFKHKLVAVHVRSSIQGGATTENSHRPKSHRQYAQQSKAHFVLWAEEIGENAKQLVVAQFQQVPEYSLQGCKACSQLQKLARQYGNHRLENACKCACDIKSLTVTSVRSILQCHMDEVDEQTPVQPQLPLHHNLRGAEYYLNGGN
ncbi:IS21 family transposase [Pseudoalteromonas phenolica]|nr:IS21 family transposase [Pseudoalteromonas phenolica]